MFNHIITAKILRNFRIEGTDKTIYCLDKKREKIYPESAKSKNPLFNLENFYSQKSLRQLLQENKHIKLNHLFTFFDEPLERNLKKCFEDKIGNITDEINEPLPAASCGVSR